MQNVLLELDRNTEAERKLLLAQLQHQGEAVDGERRRQLAIAKLNRQRRQLAQEDKINGLEFVLKVAKDNEENLSSACV